MFCTVWLIESQTPAAPSTDQTMNTETTVTTPKAIDSRKAVFITDHGSMRVSRSRARRGPLRGEVVVLRLGGFASAVALARCSSAALVSLAWIRSASGG